MDLYEHAKTMSRRIEMGDIQIEDLEEKERVLLCVAELEIEVNNGGFSQYYFNCAGAHANLLPQALHTIGAPETAQIVTKANAVLGKEIPKDIAARQNLIDGLSDEKEQMLDDLDAEFFTYPNDIDALLHDYFI